MKIKSDKILLILFCSITMIAFSCGSEQTFEVREEILNEGVYASGEIMPEEYYFLKSNVTDRLMRLLVKEGDRVSKGDILAILGSSIEDRQLEILSNQVALAQENLNENSAVLGELTTRINIARTKFRQDSLNASRYSEMLREGAVTKSETERIELIAESSKAEYENLKQQYRSRRNELSSRLLGSQQQLALLRQSREGKILESPVDGIVYSVNFEQGEMVRATEPVILVGDENKFKLELLVDERDISKVEIGQKIFFETNAYEGKQFEATVNKIIPVLQKDTRSFKIEAEVNSHEKFFPQSSVEANIVIRQNIKTLVIPTEFLLPGDSVQIRVNGKAEKISIQTGVKGIRWVEVISGLKEGDVVVK